MSMLNFKSKRDYRIDRGTDKEYSFFKKKLNMDFKETFLLSYKFALFKGIPPRKLQGKAKHIGQISKFSEREIELMIIVAFVNGFGDDVLEKGDDVLSTIEEYANSGIRLLYDLFMEDTRSDILIIEDIKNDIKSALNSLE